MRFFIYAFIGLSALTCLLSLRSPSNSSIGVTAGVEYFKINSIRFGACSEVLKSAIAGIHKNQPASIINARRALKDSRIAYKRIEFFMEYFFKSNAVSYNGPPKFEIEEPFMEWQTPIGLQVIESLLYEGDVYLNKKELTEQADALVSSAQDINALLYSFNANDQQILESLRLQLVRIITMGITGFDAPLLKTGIDESIASFESLQVVLSPYLIETSMYADSVTFYLKSGLHFLQATKDFDSFDRLTFLDKHALPLQNSIGLLIKTMQLEINTTNNVLNYNARNLFSQDALNVKAFPASVVPGSPAMIDLGKKLFSEKSLSGNNKISCATCHSPQKHFTDGLPKSIAFNGHSQVKRNAPSLFYAAFQYGQFWDGRAKTLEEQIVSVLTDSLEMNGRPKDNIHQVLELNQYTLLFKTAFPGSSDTLTTMEKVAISVASFVRTLNPRNAPFDRYMEGDKTAITPDQKHGFNLFMGKAQCGTCHFAPIFNGLAPPLYGITELEVLGTPRSDNFSKPESDNDKGRYAVFPVEYYEQAFKTPTVRNVTATAPYMHNGSFATLEKVVEFYNKGGGKGLGLNNKHQTLSAKPLNLSILEMADIVSFLRSLEDEIAP